jgi:hypothetical protein
VVTINSPTQDQIDEAIKLVVGFRRENIPLAVIDELEALGFKAPTEEHIVERAIELGLLRRVKGGER